MSLTKINTTEYRFENYYLEKLTNLKIVSSKKAFLTREINANQEHLIQLQTAYKRSGWLLGERVTLYDISKAKRELRFIKNLRACQ